jgi:hypothetical protein
MSRKKLFLIIGIVLCGLALASLIGARSSRPAGVPEDWELHREFFGGFELWLPAGWEDSGGVVDSLRFRLGALLEGSHCPIFTRCL